MVNQGKHRAAETIKSFSWTKLLLAPACLMCPEKSLLFSQLGCPSQTEALHLSHLSGDLRPFTVLVACEPFSLNSSQFLFLAHNTQPQRAPLKTVWKREKHFCPKIPWDSGACSKKILLSILSVNYFQNLLQGSSAFLSEAGYFWGTVHPAWFLPCW